MTSFNDFVFVSLRDVSLGDLLLKTSSDGPGDFGAILET